jgi:hypothetical protein
MKRVTITLTIFLLLLLSLPAMAQDVPATEPEFTWRSLFMIACVIGLALLAVVVWLATQLKNAGDQRAAALLEGIQRGIQWIPADQAAKFVKDFQTGATKTSSPADDIIGGIAGAGVDVLLKLQGKSDGTKEVITESDGTTRVITTPAAG